MISRYRTSTRVKSTSYGKNLAMHEGEVHDYLGVDHDYSEKGVIKLSMMGHVEKIFEDFPDDIGKTSSTFKVCDSEEAKKDGKLLTVAQKKAFHHSVAQLLFVSGRVRRDIQTPVAFLTTSVKKLMRTIGASSSVYSRI